MFHMKYTAVIEGRAEQRSFIPLDGVKFGYPAGRVTNIDAGVAFFEGFDDLIALQIVNRWNYIATLNHSLDARYYVHSVEGAGDVS